MIQISNLKAAIVSALVGAVSFPTTAAAQGGGAPATPADAAAPASTTLEAVVVSGQKQGEPPRLEGGTKVTVNAEDLQETVNVVNVEDSLEYLPSLLVRKRYIGDTNAPFATRTTGINASARTLVFADGIPLSSLINNNNGNGSPQWFLVSPGAVDHIDVYYGPYEAEYAGNSYGAVVDITTRLPDRFEAKINVLGSLQRFEQYATHDNYGAGEVNGLIGDRWERFRWQLGFEHLDSTSQPITFETISQSSKADNANPAVSGAFSDKNRTATPILVLGDGNITHTIQDSASLKLAYDLTDTVRTAYTLGYWRNRANTNPTSYLRDSGGAPYYGASSGAVDIGGYSYSASSIGTTFSAGHVEQDHLAQALSIGSSSGGVFDWSAIATSFNYLNDISRASSAIFTGGQALGAGKITDMGNTGWATLDLKGIWRPQGRDGANTLSFGAHGDHYRLASPVFAATDWRNGDPVSTSSDSRGKTDTYAVWAQDVWHFSPQWTATLGDRYEHWRAYSGFNLPMAGNGPAERPTVDKAGHSPKASLAWQVLPQWLLKASAGRALRFPTVGELYQNIQTGTTFTQANPFLKPEDVVSGELMAEFDHKDGYVRATLFDENVRNALISQTSFIPGYNAAPVSFVQNVDRTRQLGTEWVADQRNVLIHGLELYGSLTYVDARILRNSGYVPAASTPGATSDGKQTPYVPRWRATMQMIYRPDDKWTLSASGRYSTRQYATVDNTDVNTHTYMGFDRYLVVDLRAHYQFTRQWSGAVGIDNVNNDKYFLYHPFPQRTYNAELHYDF